MPKRRTFCRHVERSPRYVCRVVRARWDSAMFTGANVPPYYDSMLGKLIVCAPTRDGAIRKMRSALGELVIEGVSENSELQLDVLANDEFLSGMYHTDLMGHLYADE